MNVEKVFSGSPKSRFVFWEDSYAKSLDGVVTKAECEKKDVYFTLNQTIFHPKNGGQPSDKGIVKGEKFEVEVKKGILYDDTVVHFGKIKSGLPIPGGPVLQEIDWHWRYKIMRRHTCAHLLDHLLSYSMGITARTTDSWLGDPCYVGYSGRPPISQEVQSVATFGRKLIAEKREVKITQTAYDKFVEESPEAPNILRMPKLQNVRVVRIDGCQPIPCGGTHVHDLSEIPDFQITKVEPLESGFRVYYDVV